MQPRNMSMSGVVDLAAVKAAGEAKQKAEQARADAARQGGVPAAGAGRLVFDVVGEVGFDQEVLQRSAEVPVVIDFWADWCEPCKQLGPLLERLAQEYAGRFVLAKIDVEANQTLFQQFGVQSIPAVFAVVAGQALPLFQGAAPEAQIRQVLDELIGLSEQRFGIVGPPLEGGAAEAGVPQAPAGPHDGVLSAAHEALDTGDLGGAIRAYQNVLSDDPANVEAKAGLAQAELLQRVQGMDPQQVRKAAADAPGDVRAQIAAADLDLVGGHVQDAFGRLIDAVRKTAGEDRDAARVRLLELFEVIGPDDPRVTAARTALSRALF